MATPLRNRRRHQRGAAMVEAAFMLPMFVILFFTTMYLHNLNAKQIALNMTTREAAWSYAMANCNVTKDADSEVSRSAFGRLAVVDPARAETVMTARFSSPDPSARQDALWFSSQLDGDVARPYLIAALRDPSAEVVADACSRLADVGGADAQTALLAVMTNPDSTPALAAA